MATDDNEIPKLLEELHSAHSYYVQRAVQRLAKLPVKSAEVVSALEAVAAVDPDEQVRQAALQALGRGTLSKPSGHVYKTRRNKWFDFALGFVGWYVTSSLLWALPFVPLIQDTALPVIFMYALLGCLPFHIVVLIVLGRWRRWMALGVLAAFAANLTVATFLGTFFPAWCGTPFLWWQDYSGFFSSL